MQEPSLDAGMDGGIQTNLLNNANDALVVKGHELARGAAKCFKH